MRGVARPERKQQLARGAGRERSLEAPGARVKANAASHVAAKIACAMARKS